MPDRKVFHDSVMALPARTGVTPNGMKVRAKNADHALEQMSVTFSLTCGPEGTARLEEAIAAGRVLSFEELKACGAPRPDVDSLRAWLQAEGYAIVSLSGDGTSVRASAPVHRIESSLGVEMMRVTKGGLTWTAARNAPSLPAGTAASVDAILGLQPFRHMHKHLRRMPLEFLRATGPTGAMKMEGYLVSQIRHAYGARNPALSGRGQTIALLIDTLAAEGDLATFWKLNSVAVDHERIATINVNGGALPPREGEETLATEWASGIAPGAKVRVYASGSLQFVDLDSALDRIIADVADDSSMRQVAIGLGLGETYLQPGEIRAQHAKYLRLAALGVNVFVSSGAAGSNPGPCGHESNGPLQCEYAASDPAVIGVGGTSLRLAADGSLVDEIGWADGGGGRSGAFARPRWQKGAGMPTGSDRLVPDISLAADPALGAMMIFNGRPAMIGGTSWSAPVAAGFCALINDARLQAGKEPLPFLGPVLYGLAETPALRDIADGMNGAHHAQKGYDLVTGLGALDVGALTSLAA